MTTAIVTFAVIAIAVGFIVIRKRKRKDTKPTGTATGGATTVRPKEDVADERVR